MLVHDMDIARLMTHAQQIEEAKLKGRAREKKWSRNDDGDSSHVRSDRHGRSKNRQRFFGQGSFNTGKYKEDKVFSPKTHKISNESLWPTCARCGKRHEGRCLAGREGCFNCDESGHKMRDCPKAKTMIREGKQVATSGADENAQMKNRFYVLQARNEQE